MNTPTSSETEKAKDQCIRHKLLITDNTKYVKRGQALIIRDDPQRYEEVMSANRNKAGALFQYAESLFAVLAVVKSTTGYRTGACRDWQIQTTIRLSHAVARISPFTNKVFTTI